MPVPIVAAAAPIAPVVAGATGGGIAAALSGLAASPFWGSLMAMGGYRLAEGFLSPQTGYERGAQQQMQAGLSVLPELRRAAAGLPTAASKNIISQVRQEGVRQGQGYATAARRGGMLGQTPGGSQPYRAQQGRIQSDVRQIMGQRLGEYQVAAQGALTGMIQPGIQAAERQDIYRDVQENKTLGALARWMQTYRGNEADPQWKEFMELIKRGIKQAAEPVSTNPYPATT